MYVHTYKPQVQRLVLVQNHHPCLIRCFPRSFSFPLHCTYIFLFERPAGLWTWGGSCVWHKKVEWLVVDYEYVLNGEKHLGVAEEMELWLVATSRFWALGGTQRGLSAAVEHHRHDPRIQAPTAGNLREFLGMSGKSKISDFTVGACSRHRATTGACGSGSRRPQQWGTNRC